MLNEKDLTEHCMLTALERKYKSIWSPKKHPHRFSFTLTIREMQSLLIKGLRSIKFTEFGEQHRHVADTIIETHLLNESFIEESMCQVMVKFKDTNPLLDIEYNWVLLGGDIKILTVTGNKMSEPEVVEVPETIPEFYQDGTDDEVVDFIE